MNIGEYRTVHADNFRSFDQSVNKLLADGFQPFGNPYATDGRDGFYACQAIRSAVQMVAEPRVVPIFVACISWMGSQLMAVFDLLESERRLQQVIKTDAPCAWVQPAIPEQAPATKSPSDQNEISRSDEQVATLRPPNP